jgi:hypothetical protein
MLGYGIVGGRDIRGLLWSSTIYVFLSNKLFSVRFLDYAIGCSTAFDVGSTKLNHNIGLGVTSRTINIGQCPLR